MRRGCQTLAQQTPGLTRAFGSSTATALKRKPISAEEASRSTSTFPERRDWSTNKARPPPRRDWSSPRTPASQENTSHGYQSPLSSSSRQSVDPPQQGWSGRTSSTENTYRNEPSTYSVQSTEGPQNPAYDRGSVAQDTFTPQTSFIPTRKTWSLSTPSSSDPSIPHPTPSTSASTTEKSDTPQQQQNNRARPKSSSIPTRKTWSLPSSVTTPHKADSSTTVDNSATDTIEAPRTRSTPYERRSYANRDEGPQRYSQSRESRRPFDQSQQQRRWSQPDARQTTRPNAPAEAPSARRLEPRSKAVTRKWPDVHIPTTVTVSVLANILGVKLGRLQHRMKRVGMEAESSYDHILTSDLASLLAEEFRYNPIVDDEAAFDVHPQPPVLDQTKLSPRPPIVTIMGHVDHGKTTLLDTLRSASVAKGEAGGITQHIGAFSVPVKLKDSSQSITFLDTPGHAAFSQMRARGANVTDIIVLVVAADDGIMPQTKEVINLVKSTNSESSLLVAINKVDKPGVDIDAVKTALLAEGIQLEEFGGDVPSVHVSGLTGAGIPEFLETLWTMAEMMELRAETTGLAHGHVIESEVRKGLGPVATVLISRGSLKVGSHIICGLTSAKARMMTDSNGKAVKQALPGMAVTLSGWKSVPKAGDMVLEASEADIKKALVNRERKQERMALQADAEAINETRRLERNARLAEEDKKTDKRSFEADENSGPKEFRMLVKADVSGSSEAVEGAIGGIGNSQAVSKVVSSGVGDVAESDVMLAKVANASIVAFSVNVPRPIQALATQHGVPIISSNIIYKLIDHVREQVAALLPKIIETKVLGEATVLQVFEIQVKGKPPKKIAGSRITNGLVQKQKPVRIVRNGEIVFDGNLDTMRQLKKDITEARKGLECGLGFENFGDFMEGDLIQVYDRIEKAAVL